MQLFATRPRALRALASMVCLTLALSCGDSSGPDDGGNNNNPPIPVAVGDTVSGTLRSINDILRYELAPAATTEIAIFMQGLTGATRVVLLDGSQVLIGEVGFVAPTQMSLLDRRSEHLVVQGGQTYTIEATPGLANAGGQFRFWIYEVNREPETVSATLPLGTAITETLENSADIDEFFATVTPGQEVIAFLRGVNYAQAPSSLDALIAHVFEGSQNFRGVVSYSDPDTALQANSTGRFTIGSASGRVVVRNYLNTRIPGQVTDGPYQFQFQPITRAPEQIGGTLTVGDTIGGESIGHVGDIDEFTVTAAPGQQLNLFFHALGGAGNAGLTADVLGVPYSTPFPPQVASVGGDSALTRQATGTFAVGPAGTFTVRVSGSSDSRGLYRGGYRVFLYPINPLPELQPATIAPGDSVVGETIELPGDVDQFTLVATPADRYNLVVTRSNADTGTFQLTMPYDQFMIDLRTPAFTGVLTESASGSGRFPLSPGSYTLTAGGLITTGHGFRGSYRVAAFPLSDGTELAPASVVVGDTITSDLSPLGDVDRFALTGVKGDFINLMLQGLAAPSDPGSGFQLGLLDSAEAGLTGLGSYTATTPLSAHQTGRFEFPYSGSYTIWVATGNSGANSSEQGAYRFAVVPIGVGTEQVTSTLLPGDVITAEAIDIAGDVDEFTLIAPAGSEVQVYLQGGTSQALTLQALSPSSPAMLRSTTSSGFRQALGRVTIPAEGSIRLRVFGPADPASLATSYILTTFAIDSMPEGIPASIVPGDTVAQAIVPIGDIDRYTFNVTAGQQVVAYFQTPNGVPGGFLQLELLNPAGTVLGTITSQNPTINLTDLSTGGIQAGTTGTYGIRVAGLDDTAGEGIYRFQVVVN